MYQGPANPIPGVPHAFGVAVRPDRTGGMEVRWRVSGFREIAFIVVGASGGAGPLCFVDAGGVVDDRIRDHADARGLALPDHVLKFSFGAFFGVKFVAYRLIARPPLRALDAFLRRRDLYVADAFRVPTLRRIRGRRISNWLGTWSRSRRCGIARD